MRMAMIRDYKGIDPTQAVECRDKHQAPNRRNHLLGVGIHEVRSAALELAVFFSKNFPIASG